MCCALAAASRRHPRVPSRRMFSYSTNSIHVHVRLTPLSSAPRVLMQLSLRTEACVMESFGSTAFLWRRCGDGSGAAATTAGALLVRRGRVPSGASVSLRVLRQRRLREHADVCRRGGRRRRRRLRGRARQRRGIGGGGGGCAAKRARPTQPDPGPTHRRAQQRRERHGADRGGRGARCHNTTSAPHRIASPVSPATLRD